jgi:hypothetical protein
VYEINLGGVTMFKEGDDTVGFSTTVTANKYRTRRAGMNHREIHLPIERASNYEHCTQEGEGNLTDR